MEDSSAHFRYFAESLQRAIARYGHLKHPDLTALQKAQVEKLSALEDEFRATLIRHSRGSKVYEAFVAHICDERRNILAARPFFRERQRIFTRHISTALKKRAWRRLLRFHINYQFVCFALKAEPWKPRSPLRRIAKEIEAARNELVELNLPLVIQRARLFWSRTPKSHISFMDFIQIGCDGLLAAIDKFVLPYSEVFRSVAIGRMVGNFIESYSDTMLHFYPTDKRKIYRANKFLSKHPHGAFEQADLTLAVNQKADTRHRTNNAEIADLVAAASTVSSDTKAPGEGDVPDNVQRYAAPEETRPDHMVEGAEVMFVLRNATQELNLIDKKLLRMKGLDLKLE